MTGETVVRFNANLHKGHSDESLGYVDAIVGLHRGDEGKGRFVDMWAEQYDNVARYNGGPNAGHTVIMPDGKKLQLHGIPSGIGYPGKKNVIGDGVFVDAVKLVQEMEYVVEQGVDVSPDNLLISSSASLILPHHIVQDIAREGGGSGQGSTKAGIAFVDADLSLREGVRAELINNDPDGLFDRIIEGLRKHIPEHDQDLPEIGRIANRYVEQALRLGAFITDTALFLNRELADGRSILAEGAQAFLLDKYQGMYPYTTSSITTSGGISPGLGIPPQKIGKVLGVAKAVQSHVGGGHFVTEIHNSDLQTRLHGDLEAGDAEKGTTTGRLRRLGHLDIPVLRRANMVNGTTEMAITKLDWLSRYGETILVCTAYERKGKVLPIAPNAGYKLEQSTPRYEELPGWTEDISDIREFEDLPNAAQDYVHFIEDKTEVPVTLLGVGPRRDQVVEK